MAAASGALRPEAWNWDHAADHLTEDSAAFEQLGDKLVQRVGGTG